MTSSVVDHPPSPPPPKKKKKKIDVLKLVRVGAGVGGIELVYNVVFRAFSIHPSSLNTAITPISPISIHYHKTLIKRRDKGRSSLPYSFSHLQL